MERKLWILSAFIVGIVVGALGVGLGVALGVGLSLDFKRCNEVSNISLGTTTLSTTTFTTSTTSPAPADYIYSNQTFGSFYYKLYGRKTWDAAKRACEEDGAELPVPRSDDENEYFATLRPGQSSIWLGINDVETEGVWVDNDGKRISYQNWGNGEPNNGGISYGYGTQQEDAASIGRWSGSSKWNDAWIEITSYTLCIFYP